ncbi:MAG: GNAT family N-acetyltransferase [Candidatus Limnocylindrales bacterium]
MDGDDIRIVDRPEANRYEALLGEDVAGFVDYRVVGGHRVLLHTEVLPAYEGRGIGSLLARHVLAASREAGERVSIKCPFLSTYIRRHPDEAPAAASPHA